MDQDRRKIACLYAHGFESPGQISHRTGIPEETVNRVLKLERHRKRFEDAYSKADQVLSGLYPNDTELQDKLLQEKIQEVDGGIPIEIVKQLLKEHNFFQPLLDVHVSKMRYVDHDSAEILETIYLSSLREDVIDLAVKKKWPIVPKVHVYFSGRHLEFDEGELRGGTPPIENPPQLAERLAHCWDLAVLDFAQQFVRTMLSIVKNDRIGLSWGRQLRAVIDALDNHLKLEHKPPKDTSKFEAVPLVGTRHVIQRVERDRIFGNPEQFSAYTLAKDLVSAVTRNSLRNDRSHLYWNPWPDMLGFNREKFTAQLSPEEIEEERKNGIEAKSRINASSPGRQNVENTLMELDVILAGIGAPGTLAPLANYTVGEDDHRHPNADYGGVPAAWFRDNTVGDLGSVPLPAEHLLAPSRQHTLPAVQWKRIQDSWMGLTLEQLRVFAKKNNSKTDKIRGIVAIGVGRNREKCCFEAMRTGLINHLCIDHILALNLQKLVQEKRVEAGLPPTTEKNGGNNR